jgi:hypothetical protein
MAYRGSKSDALQEAVGDFGRWQAGISLLMALLKLPIAWFQLSIIILEAHTDFWCARPLNLYGNLTIDEWRNLSHPRVEDVSHYMTSYLFSVLLKQQMFIREYFLNNKYSSK